VSNFNTSKIIKLSTTFLYGFSTENKIWVIKHITRGNQCVQYKTATNNFQLLFTSKINHDLATGITLTLYRLLELKQSN
jgi:hypothetical protein